LVLEPGLAPGLELEPGLEPVLELEPEQGLAPVLVLGLVGHRH